MSETVTMTLTEFLLARIAEDEAVARAAEVEAEYAHFGDTAAEALLGLAESEGAQSVAVEHYRRHDPARILAECKAKRRIVEKAQRANMAMDSGINPASAAASFALTEVLHYLALPYADHPDHRDEWKP